MKTPTILQMEVTECGAAALSIIFGYYGQYISLEDMRVKCGVSRDGSKALNMIKAAREQHMEAVGVQIEDLKDLQEVTFPCILFWKFNHFVVLERIQGSTYYINDPAVGRRKIDAKEMGESFTGVALDFTPTDKFVKSGKRPSAVKSLSDRLKGSTSAVLFVLLASLCLVIPGILIPGFSKIFIDDILIRDMNDWFVPLLVGMMATALLRGVFQWFQQYYLLRLKIKMMAVNSAKFLWHVFKLPIHFFHQRYTGDILERISANNRVANLLSGELAGSIVSIISIVFFAIVMTLISWQLTVLVVLVAVLNLGLFMMLSRKIEDVTRQFMQESGKLTGVELNGLQMVESLKAMGSEDDFFVRWSGLHAKTINHQQAMMTYNQILSILPILLSGLSSVAVLGFGSWQIMEGVLSVGALVAFQSLTMSFQAPIFALLSMGNQLQQIRADLSRLDDVLKHPEDARLAVTEGSEDLEDSDDPSTLSDRFTGALTVRDMCFGYCKLDSPFLQNFSMELKPGKRVAIVGPSGSGKSTLAKLLCGMYEPWEGEIAYDHIPLTRIPQYAFDRSFSLVDQDILLFEGTIADNLSLWDKRFTEEDMIRALKDACLFDVVYERHGLKTQVAEGGSNFSGGQRQRLEIARALVNNPRLVILDEATSALDPIIEKRIYDNLKERGCALVVIAHRLSAIRDCEEIIVLDQGKVVQRGRHEVLALVDGPYKTLIHLE